MRFQDVLPHLEAGRKVRRGLYVYFLGDIDCEIPLDWLVASDWEVVEEPAPAKPAPVDWRAEYEQQHALTEHWKESALRHEVTIALLERELAEARASYVQQSRKCCRCCECFLCQSQRQSAALAAPQDRGR